MIKQSRAWTSAKELLGRVHVSMPVFQLHEDGVGAGLRRGIVQQRRDNAQRIRMQRFRRCGHFKGFKFAVSGSICAPSIFSSNVDFTDPYENGLPTKCGEHCFIRTIVTTHVVKSCYSWNYDFPAGW